VRRILSLNNKAKIIIAGDFNEHLKKINKILVEINPQLQGIF